MNEDVYNISDFEDKPRNIQHSSPIENPDQGKWEMDTDPWVNRLYHELLGESVNEEGVWVRDLKKKKIMNSDGASEFISEVSSRVSIHMQLSELTDQEIAEIASWSAQVFGDKITDHWREWGINPSRSNCESIGNRLYDILFIMLRIARNGGMKKHRERGKNPQIMAPPREVGGII